MISNISFYILLKVSIRVVGVMYSIAASAATSMSFSAPNNKTENVSGGISTAPRLNKHPMMSLTVLFRAISTENAPVQVTRPQTI